MARHGGCLAPPQALAVPMEFEPAEIHSLAETGLNPQFLADLALKTVYYASTISGHDVALRMRLPFLGVVDEVLDALKRESLVEVRGGNVLTSASYTYLVTAKGADRASELIDRCAYAGAAPVSLGDYWVSVQAQSVTNVSVNQRDVHEAYGEMVISDKLMNQLGPAINSAQSIFLFGPPGNGKTSLAETASRLLGGAVYIPYALEHDGQVIKLYDSTFHAALENDDRRTLDSIDRRWVRSRRPVVVVGGELTMQALDLVYSDTSKFYEAPLQLKANCGMFLIDDFGRQQMSPRDLLNRWIVPLEKREDYLNMQTGQELTVPFDQLIIFSTNLEPANRVAEAFLRRLRFKIEVAKPTIVDYEKI